MDQRVETGERPQPDRDRRAPERKERDVQQPADAAAGDEKKPSALRRHPLLFAGAVIGALLIAVAGYAYWQIYVYPFETTDDAFVDARSYVVAPKVSGYVVDALVSDNQHVEAGAVLFEIDKRDYEVAVTQARAQVEAAEASVQNADAQIAAQQAQVDVAKSRVENAEASLKFAQEDASRYKDLAQTGAGSVQRQQQTNTTLLQQQSSLAEAKAGVVAADKQVGSLKAQRSNAVAQLDQAKARLAQTELDLGYTTVRAAQPGRLVRFTGSKGQFAQAGAGLSNFVPDEIWVTANFKETQVTDMRPGQAVDLEIDAYPDRDVKGRVDSVQPGSGTAFSLLPAENATGNYVKVTQRIPVKIVVDRWPDDVAIGPGMSVVPTVHVR
ncbi:HlyD family secretion protein [Hansschlegelia quercus]|uniref:HlyD family secretion protein n=1 Tax=Hansschlegelia quercus TaxID=2528245 RepID=A0A4Q9GIN0_9HYPH|nr:HlyD family secretion protein [Hansschlegelia quercus]TBN51823.1 HlyD family secretion protein [Hansschlegelia quercus]